MSSALILSSENADQATAPYYSFTYKFPTNIDFSNKQLAPTTIIVPFSWFNFSGLTNGTLPGYNNDVFSYIWIDGTVNTVTMGAGYFSTTDLNQAMYQVMIQNNQYLINANGDFLYYLQIQDNPNYYSIQFNSYPLPTAAAAATAGLTQPAGATWSFPSGSGNYNPQLTVPTFTTNNTNTSFSQSVGFLPGNYPSVQTGNVAYSVLSSFTPELNPVTSVTILCTLLDNRYVSPNTVLYTFNATNVGFGEYVEIQVPQLIWQACSRGSFQQFKISFVDQTLQNYVPLQDPTITLMLSLIDKNDR